MLREILTGRTSARSRSVIDIVARAAPGCAIGVIVQYRPAFRAHKFFELCGWPDSGEVALLQRYAAEQGLVRVDH